MFNLVKEPTGETCSAMRCKDSVYQVVTGEKFGRASDQIPLCQRHHGVYLEELAVESIDEVEESAELIVKREATEAEEALALVTTFEIHTQDDLDFAATMLAEAKGRWKNLDEKEKEITKPMNEALRNARDLFRKPKMHYSRIEDILKQKIGAHALGEAERNKAAMLEASQAHHEGDTEAASAAISKIASIADVSGVTVYTQFDYEIVNESLLPREFLTPNHKLLKEAAAHATKGEEPLIPGVRFFEKSVVRSKSAVIQ